MSKVIHTKRMIREEDLDYVDIIIQCLKEERK